MILCGGRELFSSKGHTSSFRPGTSDSASEAHGRIFSICLLPVTFRNFLSDWCKPVWSGYALFRYTVIYRSTPDAYSLVLSLFQYLHLGRERKHAVGTGRYRGSMFSALRRTTVCCFSLLCFPRPGLHWFVASLIPDAWF